MRKFTIDAGMTAPYKAHDWSDYGPAFFRFLAVFCLVYLSALSTFTFSIDDESAALRTSAGSFVWLLQGRWTLYLIEKYIVTRPAIVTFPLMIFGMFASASYVFLAKSMEIRLQDARNYALFTIFCAFPTIFFIVNFMSNLVGLGLGIFCCSLAVLLFKQELLRDASTSYATLKRSSSFAMQTVLIACAAGAYQSLLLYSAVAYVVIGLNHFSTHREFSLVRLGLWQIYSIITVMSGAVLGIAVGVMLGAPDSFKSSYTGGYFRPDMLFEMPAMVSLAVFGDYKAVYGGSKQVFAFDYISIPALILVGLIAALVSGSARSLVDRLYILICMALLTILPFAMNFLTGGGLPYRALLAVPLVIWAFACAASFSGNRVLGAAGTALSAILALQCIYTLALLQTNKRLAFQNDVQLASRIFERVSVTVPGFSINQLYPIDFYGGYKYTGPYQEISQSTYSASFFEWNGGNSDRILGLLNILGYTNLVRPSGVQRLATMAHWQAMPIWPQVGSVQFIDGTILVRLGEKAGLTHADIAVP